MWLSRVFIVIYVIGVNAAQDIEEPPSPILQLKTPWKDVFPSEEVEFICGIAGSSNWTFILNKDGVKRASFPEDDSPLRFNVTTAGTGNYSCVGKDKRTKNLSRSSNSVVLVVYGNKPKPDIWQSSSFEEMYIEESISLKCNVTISSGWEYLWYHNGKEISINDTLTKPSLNQSDGGRYKCRAKRGSGPFFSQNSKVLSLKVSDPPTPTLKLQTRWNDVFEKEVVEFTCDLISLDWTFTWYRNKTELMEDDDLIMDDEGSLNITSVSQAHHGLYACRAQLPSRGVQSAFSNTEELTVYETIPEAVLTTSPVYELMYVGETVNFTCNVFISFGWKYLWYKDGRMLFQSSQFISVSLSHSDGGKYSCKGTRSETTATKQSKEMQLNVAEIPSPSVKLLNQWADVFPTESVKFRCGMQSGFGWTYTWYKDTERVQADGTVSVDSSGATLFIKSASPANQGDYQCDGRLKGRAVKSKLSSEQNLHVYDKWPTVTLTQLPKYKVMFYSEEVSFTCHVNVTSAWEYMWYKDHSLVASGNKIYTLKLEGKTNSGSYECQAKRGKDDVFNAGKSPPAVLNVKEEKPKPIITQKPNVQRLFVGESVSFDCKVIIASGWSYQWYKGGALLSNNSSHLEVSNVTVTDSGIYECKATREHTLFPTQHSKSLQILERPVPILKLVTPWAHVFPSEAVIFNCEIQNSSSDWSYEWYRNEKRISHDGTTRMIISKASKPHIGKYRCLGKLRSRSVDSKRSSELPLKVYDTGPSVSLLREPTHSVMYTGDSVSFSCNVSVPSKWKYVWSKDGRTLPIHGNNHSISSVATASTGSYKCEVKRETTATSPYSVQSRGIKLEVKERPQAAIHLVTGWSKAFSADSLELKCEVDSQGWNYTWYKEEQPINSPPSEKHIVTPQNDPDQSQYACQGYSNGRPSYSKRSNFFQTKNLLLKRRVLLSISGVIVFGIVAVFLGCVVFRVFHKPVEDNEKPEEANLFLSMPQLKDFTDTACPLAEFITEAALNAPAQAAEVEENGVVCSDTTPLPITSPEERDVMDDNKDQSKNNGGLTSFQQ